MDGVLEKAQADVLALRERIPQLDPSSLDLIFREARSFNGWQDRPVADGLVRQLYEIVKSGPTSANCQPACFLFLRTPAAKERLRPALAPGNVDKTMGAPVIAIIGYDIGFVDRLKDLFPHKDMTGMFRGNDALIESTAFRNSTLQGGFLILAARALGLDTGPMSGFDNKKVDAEFFPGSTIKSNFLCNIGYGDEKSLFARSPRLPFEDACQLL